MLLAPQLSPNATSRATTREIASGGYALLEFQSPSAAVVAMPTPRGARKVVWVLVTWREGTTLRRVTSQAVKFNPVSLTGIGGGG